MFWKILDSIDEDHFEKLLEELLKTIMRNSWK